jgi:hypothetical protein
MNQSNDYGNHYGIMKGKGLYHRSQEYIYEQCQKRAGCRINKKLPGTLGSAEAISRKEYESQLINGVGKRNTCARFVLNGDENGQRAGQPGGITPPIRNRF